MFAFRASRRQPARGGIRKRPPSARCRAQENCRTGHHGGPAVRHKSTATGVTWLRVQDTDQVLRDWVHSPGLYRRQQN